DSLHPCATATTLQSMDPAGISQVLPLPGPRELPTPQRFVSRHVKYGKSAIFSLIWRHIAPYSAMTRQLRIVAPRAVDVLSHGGHNGGKVDRDQDRTGEGAAREDSGVPVGHRRHRPRRADLAHRLADVLVHVSPARERPPRQQPHGPEWPPAPPPPFPRPPGRPRPPPCRCPRRTPHRP